ncbi:MAG TPA: type I-E CRISPR-associated protein Cas7/Cse4/CasC, partial [Candidatus Krumholzibacteria bacterium]
MTTFIEMHALRSFPPSNLNRDDLGTPKTAVFGGVRRLRISSQCLKRTWRMSEHFRGAFAEEQLGVRTDRLVGEVFKVIEDSLDEASRDGLVALLGSI